MIRLKCNKCPCTTNAPSIKLGDLCPHCGEGEMVPIDPTVFSSHQEFVDRLTGLKPPTKTTAVTIQAGVKPDGTAVLMIAGIRLHIYQRSPCTDGWEPYRLDGSEVFNVRRVF